jgi:hypothetical protein
MKKNIDGLIGEVERMYKKTTRKFAKWGFNGHIKKSCGKC